VAHRAQELDHAGVGPQGPVRAPGLQGDAQAPGGEPGVVEAVPGVAHAGKHQPGAVVKPHGGVGLLEEPHVGRAQGARPQRAVPGHLHGRQPGHQVRQLLLLEDHLQGGGVLQSGGHGQRVGGGEALEALGDVEAGGQLVAPVQHVQVPVAHREAGSGVGAVAHPGAQGPAGSLLEVDAQRDVAALRLRGEDHLLEALGSRQLHLGQAEAGAGEGIARLEGHVAPEKRCRVVGGAQDAGFLEAEQLAGGQDQVQGGGQGGRVHDDLVAGEVRVQVAQSFGAALEARAGRLVLGVDQGVAGLEGKAGHQGRQGRVRGAGAGDLHPALADAHRLPRRHLDLEVSARGPGAGHLDHRPVVAEGLKGQLDLGLHLAREAVHPAPVHRARSVHAPGEGQGLAHLVPQGTRQATDGHLHGSARRGRKQGPGQEPRQGGHAGQARRHQWNPPERAARNARSGAPVPPGPCPLRLDRFPMGHLCKNQARGPGGWKGDPPPAMRRRPGAFPAPGAGSI